MRAPKTFIPANVAALLASHMAARLGDADGGLGCTCEGDCDWTGILDFLTGGRELAGAGFYPERHDGVACLIGIKTVRRGVGPCVGCHPTEVSAPFVALAP
jgi:hypothetical protein